MKLSTPIVLLLLSIFTTQVKTENKKCNSQKDCEKDECCTRKFAFDNAYCKKKLEEKKNCLPYLPMRVFDDVYMLSCPCKEGLYCKHRSINSDGGILISYHPRCFPPLSGKPDSEFPEKPKQPNGGGDGGGGDNIPGEAGGEDESPKEAEGGEDESPKEAEGGESNGGDNPEKESGDENGDSPKESDDDNGGGGGGDDSVEPEGSNGGEEGNESGGTDTGVEVEGSNGSESDTGNEPGVISPRNN